MLPAVPASGLDADAGMRLLPGDGTRRRSLLPVLAAMKRSGLPTPCSTAAAAPRRLVKRPAAEAAPALTPPLTPPQGPPPKHTSTPLLLSFSQIIEVSCQPTPLFTANALRHQHSQSFDSAIGSSIASIHGDAAEAIYAPLDISAATSRLPPTPSPQNIPRSDSPTIGHTALARPATVKGAFQTNPPNRTAPMPPATEEAVDERDQDRQDEVDEEEQERVLLAIDVAGDALARVLGGSLEALELRDAAIGATEAYLQDLINIVKKDSHCSTLVLAHWTIGDSPIPCADQDTPSDQQHCQGAAQWVGGPGRSAASGTLKRSRPAGDEDGGDNERGPNEKRRVGDEHTTKAEGLANKTLYSCPFRKLSPPTFHVRGHPKCANQPWKGMTELKSVTQSIGKLQQQDTDRVSRRHIASDHYTNRFPCLRCKKDFGSKEALENHQSRPDCVFREGLPDSKTMLRLEDGITRAMQARLISRKGTDKINDWDTLWSAIFGNKVPIRDSCKCIIAENQRAVSIHIDILLAFVPPIELVEVQVELNRLMPEFLSELSSMLQSPISYYEAILGQEINSGDPYQLNGVTPSGVVGCVRNWILDFFEQCKGIPAHQKPSRTELQQFEEPQASQESVALSNAITGSQGTVSIGDHYTLTCSDFSVWETSNNNGEPLVYDSHAAAHPTEEFSHIPGSVPTHNPISERYVTSGLLTQPTAAPLPTPLAVETTRRHGIWRAPPPLRDAVAERAVESAIAQESARAWSLQQEPIVAAPENLALRTFQDRNSGQYKAPSQNGVNESTYRDSGVSVGSSYSGFGRASSGQWRFNRPSSLASSRRESPSVGSGEGKANSPARDFSFWDQGDNQELR